MILKHSVLYLVFVKRVGGLADVTLSVVDDPTKVNSST